MMRLAILISGNGSNLQAIIDACNKHKLNAQIVLVISNQADAYGITRARQHNLVHKIIIALTAQTRQEYDNILADQVASVNPDWIILAGFMRILSADFIQRFSAKIINIHPALPGKFAGTKAIERAFAAFCNQKISETGVMIHQVISEEIDSGPVLAQKTIPILKTDTISSLSKRIHQAEHDLIISVLQQLEDTPCLTPYCPSMIKAA